MHKKVLGHLTETNKKRIKGRNKERKKKELRVGGIELPTLGLETVCLNCSTSFSGFFIKIYFFNFEGETELGWLLEEAKGRFVPIFFFIFHFFR